MVLIYLNVSECLLQKDKSGPYKGVTEKTDPTACPVAPGKVKLFAAGQVSQLEARLAELDDEREELAKFRKVDKERRSLEYTIYDKDLHETKHNLEQVRQRRSLWQSCTWPLSRWSKLFVGVCALTYCLTAGLW